MASLLNTKWQIVAENAGFVTTQASFETGGNALCEFPIAVSTACMGLWHEDGDNFRLSFVWGTTVPITMEGSHQNAIGTGVATIGPAGKQTICKFTMSKM